MRNNLQGIRAGITAITLLALALAFQAGCGGGGSTTSVPGCPYACCDDAYCDDGYTCCNQQCMETWSVTFGGGEYDSWKTVRAAGDGGYIFVGRTQTFGSLGDNMWVGKTDPSGIVEWHYALGGTGNDYGYGADVLKSGNYVFVGSTASFYDSNGDAWVYVITPAVKVVKTFSIGGSLQDSFQSVAAMPGGGYVAAGLTRSKGAGDSDAWIVRFDSDNSVMWDTVLGDTLPDIAQAVIPTVDGGIVFAGSYYEYFVSGGTAQEELNCKNAWVVKLNSSGVQEWSTRIGGDSLENAFAIREASSGGYIVAGDTLSYGENGSKDMFVIRLDSAGEILWSTAFGSTLVDVANDVIETDDRGFIVVGYTYQGTVPPTADLILLKVTADGTGSWSRHYGSTGDDVAYSIIESADGGYIVAGNTAAYSADGTSDAWLLKLDSSGRIRDISSTIHSADPSADRTTAARFKYVSPQVIRDLVNTTPGQLFRTIDLD